MEHTLIKFLRVTYFIWLFSINHTFAGIQPNQGNDTFNTVLFRISFVESKHVSYLFGTHHAFGKEFFDSLFYANQALRSCELLIKENINVPGAMAGDLINHRTPTLKWKNYLGKEDLGFINSLFATSPTDFRKMTPAELYVFLNRYYKQQICLQKGPDDTSLSLDDYIGMLATEQNIELLGLETTEEQIHLINMDVEGMPRKSHKRRLANIIEKIRLKKTNDCGEIKWYSQMHMNYQLDAPCRNNLVLTDRNDKWIKTIIDQIERNNCFIAVGLSHLMYECGLIQQLRKLGYIITPIMVND